MSTELADAARDEHLLGPFVRASFRADLAALATSSRDASRHLAADVVLLARLAGQVPRAPGDERGGTAWTSFLREVAVARRCSDRGAATDVALAQQLTGHLPRLLSRLGTGDLPVAQARAFVEQTWGCSDRTLDRLDRELADRACRLSPSRLRDAVRKVVLREEAEVIAARSARAAASRDVRRCALQDDQAELALTGPAVPLAQAFAGLDADARALRADGDPRTLAALRFDLALSRLLGDHAQPVTPHAHAHVDACATSGPGPCGCPTAVPDPTAPGWLTDRRWSRPVQLLITVPVTTALGLGDDPGWLAGHGWISAPTCRQLQVTAELRQLCLDHDTGRLVDLADRPVRPAPTPAAVSAALRDMASRPFQITDKTWQSEPQHDPGDSLRQFVQLRDQLCDGPTGTRTSATRAHLDHDTPYPDGPTAAWNLIARGGRTHALKHRGWTPLRTETSTLWFSPAGQVVEVPHLLHPPPALDPHAQLPDPQQLHDLEAELLRPTSPDEEPPW